MTSDEELRILNQRMRESSIKLDRMIKEQIKGVRSAFEDTYKIINKQIDESVDRLKPLEEDTKKTIKDFEKSSEIMKKNLRKLGALEVDFFKDLKEEADTYGESSAKILKERFDTREKYLKNELALFKAQHKKLELDWRGQKSVIGRMSSLVKGQFKKSALGGALSSIKDFIKGNQEAMMENELKAIDANKDMLQVTRNREEIAESNSRELGLQTKYQRDILLAQQKAKTDEDIINEKKRQLLYDRMMEEKEIDTMDASSVSILREKLRRRENASLSDYNETATQSVLERQPTNREKRSNPDLQVQVSNNKLLKKIVKNTSEFGFGKSLGNIGKMLAIGGVAFMALKALWSSIGSKNPVENALGTLKMLPKIGKGLIEAFKSFGIMGKLMSVGKVASKILPKTFKKIGLSALKKIPGIGAIAGLILGIKRFKDGEQVKGIMEIGSGLASIFPGVGTAISLAIDSALMFMDYKDIGDTQIKEAIGAKAIQKSMNKAEVKLQKKLGGSVIGNFFEGLGRFVSPGMYDQPKVKAANGGIFTQPTRALIGEAGPEAVIPLNKYVPKAVSEKSLERIKDNEKKNELLMESLKEFLKKDFIDSLGKKLLEVGKKMDSKTAISSGFSGYSFGTVGE